MEGDKLFIDKYFWLDVEMKNNSSRIAISKTEINGGRIQVKNVRSFLLTECVFEKNVPKIAEYVAIDTTEKIKDNAFDFGFGRKTFANVNFTDFFPDLQGEKLVEVLPTEVILPAAVIKLEYIEDFNIQDFGVRQVASKSVIIAKKGSLCS